MLNDSFTVNFRSLAAFVVIIVRDDYESGKSVVRALVGFPSIAYGRKDGRVTLRSKVSAQTRTVTLNPTTTILGVTKDGVTVTLFGLPDFSTEQGIAAWANNDPEFVGYMKESRRINAIKRLRTASIDAGQPLGLKEAKEATESDLIYPLYSANGESYQAYVDRTMRTYWA